MFYDRLMTSFIISLCFFCNVAFARDLAKPNIMLANVYHQGVDLKDYLVSEKYDGVRAIWDGSQFISRGGNIYHAPKWFTADFPQVKLDGELWIARQSFELLVSTVRDDIPDHQAWSKVKFMVFDIPDVAEVFDKRLIQLNKVINTAQIPWLQAVEQYKLLNHQALMKRLAELKKQGAEGLMLHKGSSLYRAKRSGDLLKVKPYEDAEAVVIGHVGGKGKYKNMLGAITMITTEGKQFKIGTGFTDSDRKNPPTIGTTITYQFRGLTKNGIPKHASFLRERLDANQ